MGAGADGQPGGHGVLHPEQLDEQRGRDAAEDACDQHRHHGDGADAAVGLGYADGNGGGDGFGQEGRGHGRVQPKQAAEQKDAAHGGRRAHHAPNQNGQPVLLQNTDFPVDGHRQAGGGGGEKHVDDLPALMIGLIGNAEQQQHPHHQDDANEQGITDHQAGLFLDAHPNPEGQDTQSDAKKGGSKQLRHGTSSSPAGAG